MTITERNDHYELCFPPRKVLMDQVKSHFPSNVRKYDPVNKVYLIDKSVEKKVKAATGGTYEVQTNILDDIINLFKR